jgi:hypothetical protein
VFRHQEEHDDGAEPVDEGRLRKITSLLLCVLAATVNSTLVAGENLTVGSTVWLPAENLAPRR